MSFGGSHHICKWRPQRLDDVIGFEDLKSIFRDFFLHRQLHLLPHLMITGAYGTGKTSLMNAFTKELYPSDRDLQRYVLYIRLDEEKKMVNHLSPQMEDFLTTWKQSSSMHPAFLIVDEAHLLTSKSVMYLSNIIRDLEHQEVPSPLRFVFITSQKDMVLNQPYLSEMLFVVESDTSDVRQASKALLRLFPLLEDGPFEVPAPNSPEEDTLLSIVKECRGDLRKSVSLLVSILKRQAQRGSRRLPTPEEPFLPWIERERVIHHMSVHLQKKQLKGVLVALQEQLRCGYVKRYILDTLISSHAQPSDLLSVSNMSFCRTLAQTETKVPNGPFTSSIAFWQYKTLLDEQALYKPWRYSQARNTHSAWY